MPDTAPAVTPENDDLHHRAFHEPEQPTATDEEIAALDAYTVTDDPSAVDANDPDAVELADHPHDCDGEC